MCDQCARPLTGAQIASTELDEFGVYVTANASPVDRLQRRTALEEASLRESRIAWIGDESILWRAALGDAS